MPAAMPPIQTTAVKDGDEYVLNGTKQWITNGGEADIYTVIACTDRSKGARLTFIVEKHSRLFRKKGPKWVSALPSQESLFSKTAGYPLKPAFKGRNGFYGCNEDLDRPGPGCGTGP